MDYFAKVPNCYVRCDIRKIYGVSRKFYITYILINRYRSLEGYSWITVSKILKFYGYKTFKRKNIPFQEVIDVLKFMVNKKMIKVNQDLDAVSCDTGIEIQVIPEFFDVSENFTKLHYKDLDIITESGISISKETLLLSYLYVCSYIGCSSQEGNPEAFFRSITAMSDDLNISRDTLTACMQTLISIGLLIKYEINSSHAKGTNIYVLNKENYQQEIERTLQYLLTKKYI